MDTTKDKPNDFTALASGLVFISAIAWFFVWCFSDNYLIISVIVFLYAITFVGLIQELVSIYKKSPTVETPPVVPVIVNPTPHQNCCCCERAHKKEKKETEETVGSFIICVALFAGLLWYNWSTVAAVNYDKLTEMGFTLTYQDCVNSASRKYIPQTEKEQDAMGVNRTLDALTNFVYAKQGCQKKYSQ